MRPACLLTLLLGLLIFAPAHASSKQEKIHELIVVTGVPDQLGKAMESLWPIIIGQSMAANPTIPKKIWDDVRTIGRDEFSKSLPDVIQEFERLYDINFTEDEIEALLTFYKTPAGNSVMNKLNDMGPQTAALGQAWGAQVSKRVIARLSEEMHNKGYDIHL